MRIAPEGLRYELLELRFDVVDRLARRETGAVADAEDVRVDGEGLFAERAVEHDVRCLAADTGKGLKFLARPRDIAVDQRFAERDDVLRLSVEQADGLNSLTQRFFAEIHHLPRSLDPFEKRPGGDVHACICRLGGQDDGYEQLIGIARLQLGRRRRVRFGQAPEEFENLVAGHSEPMTSRIE
jgi:hypothetical protein